jgi:hypothetical protein
MVDYADVRHERGCQKGFAVACVTDYVAALTFVHVTFEVDADNITALGNREGSMVHLNAENLNARGT